MSVAFLNTEIEQLQAKRNRLASEIRAQERLLARLRGEVAQVRHDRLTAFDEEVAELSEWLQDSRAGVIRRLRVRVENGDDVDLVATVKAAPIER